MSTKEIAASPPNPERRELLAKASAAAGGLALAGAAAPFLASLAPSERARAQGAPVDFDPSKLAPGVRVTVEWRSKPVWLLRRTPEMLARLEGIGHLLTDPHSAVTSQQPEYARNAKRSIRPETLVVVGICTHLGCIPSYYPEPGTVEPGWPGGWYCPCHGSKFDLAGRVHRGSPAPTNLVIPPHVYAGETRLVIGGDRTT